MVDLQNRLKNLGFVPASSLKIPNKEFQRKIEDELGGYRIISNQGEIIVVENIFPYGSAYGDLIIQNENKSNEIYKFCKSTTFTTFIRQHVFIDTETTGLNGGTGTIPFLLGFGFYNEKGFITRQFFLDDPSDELAQLIEFSREMEKFETTVTFNGKSFDLPLLKTRFLLAQLSNPLDSFSHIDLLHISRKIWKNRLPDRSLKELESNILGYTRSQEDIPGWLIPQVYFDYLRTGDSSQLRNVIYHNQIDIVSMAVLYQKIDKMLLGRKIINSIDPLDLFSIAQMYLQINEIDEAICLFEKCLLFTSLSISIFQNIHMNLGMIFKKRKEFEKSIPHWIASAELDNIEACIELAKYFEHQERNSKEANFWANKAYNLLEASNMSKHQKIREFKKIQKRTTRLLGRIQSV